MFNGGEDTSFYKGLPIDLCPYSKPLKHGKLSEFHYGVMKMLEREQFTYDFLVTLDSDMLLIKPGFEEFIHKTMKNSLYMGVNFQTIDKGTEWIIGRRFLYKWKSKFQKYFQIEKPYGSFNPCQVFRHKYVQKFVEDAMTVPLLHEVGVSKLEALEEIIYASYAVKIKANPVSNPGSHALVLRRHSVEELDAYLRDDQVFFVHKVGMNYKDPDRVFIRNLIKNKNEKKEQVMNEDYLTHYPVSLRRKALSWCKDIYLKLFA
ncbi:hypothetical protein [Bacillus sp. V5-8f]|uniref:hypothetical protein n=1 Tax=Bacillus sp. V5-8f TaxID=2053044 RepID=UPI000C770FC6|nr:hypothetical protein [Bacillus sp. V5-8f]PLT35745.1 hypothetical protein CUU64_00235 [Bacillus sp. V5-8f]